LKVYYSSSVWCWYWWIHRFKKFTCGHIISVVVLLAPWCSCFCCSRCRLDAYLLSMVAIIKLQFHRYTYSATRRVSCVCAVTVTSRLPQTLLLMPSYTRPLIKCVN